MCCSFKDDTLHTLTATSGYLSSCRLSVIFSRSANSPLTFDINITCSSTSLSLTGYFLSWTVFCESQRLWIFWNISSHHQHKVVYNCEIERKLYMIQIFLQIKRWKNIQPRFLWVQPITFRNCLMTANE